MRAPSKAQKAALGTDNGLAEMARETEGLKPPDPEKLTDCGDGHVKPILTYPNYHLRNIAGEVDDFGEDLRKLVADLATTMYSAGAIGIAAPQIGIPARVFLVDILNGIPPEEQKVTNQLLVAVNPKIWPLPGKTRKDAERCLSFPDIVELIERPTQVILKAYNHRGKPYALSCGADLSRAIQHEYDHLNGKLLADYMPKKKVKVMKRELKYRSDRRRRVHGWHR